MVKETVYQEVIITDLLFFSLFPHHCTSVSSISPLHYFAKASHFSQRESMTKEDEINTHVCYTLEFP